MVLVPPTAAAARPPDTTERRQQKRPAALDPELEARLRRQRAREYGRGVRQSLAAWHVRYSAKKQEQLAAQREQWEAERAARLARLAEKQQKQQQQLQHPHRFSSQPRPGTPRPGAATVASKAAQGAAAPMSAALIRAAHQQDATLSSPAKSKRHVLTAVQDPQVAQQLPVGHGPARSSRPRPASRGAVEPPMPEGCSPGHGLEPAAPPGVPADVDCGADSPAAAPPLDPLEALLGELLSAEGPGDPFSIINLFIEEQLQLMEQQFASTSKHPGHLRASAANATAAAGAWMKAGNKTDASGSPKYDKQPPKPELASQRGQQQAQHASAARQTASEAPDAENVPANVRHRRTNSMLLAHLDVATAAAAAAAEQPEALPWVLSSAVEQQPPATQPVMPVGSAATHEALASEHQQHLQASQQTHQAPQPPCASCSPLQPPPLLEQAQASSSKHLYVRQWLQASSAELAAASSPPASTFAAYSVDRDHAEHAGIDRLPSTPSSGHTVQPKGPAVEAQTDASTGAVVQQQQRLPAASNDGSAVREERSASAAEEAPSAAAAAAAAAASEVAADGFLVAPPAADVASTSSTSGRSAFAVTSTQRPDAPLPPGSSSQPLDASTALSGSMDFGSARMELPVGQKRVQEAADSAAAFVRQPNLQAAQVPQQEDEEALAGQLGKHQADAAQQQQQQHRRLMAAVPSDYSADWESGSFNAAPSAARNSSSSSSSSSSVSGKAPFEPHYKQQRVASDAPLADHSNRSSAASSEADLSDDKLPQGQAATAAASSAARLPPATAAESATAPPLEPAHAGADKDVAQHAGHSEVAYSTDSDFDSEVEISYGDQYGSQPSSPRRSFAASAAVQQHHVLDVTASAGGRNAASSQLTEIVDQPKKPNDPVPVLAANSPCSSPCPACSQQQQEEQQQREQQQAQSQQQQEHQHRPRSPLHAQDDRYPGSPPASPGRLVPSNTSLPRPSSGGGSRPQSPTSIHSSRCSSVEGSTSLGSVSPTSPPAAGAQEAAQQQEARTSPSSGSPANSKDGEQGSDSHASTASDSPYALLLFGTEPEEVPGSSLRATPHGGSTAEVSDGNPSSPAGGPPPADVAGSPPGTPVLMPPAEQDAASCPGSAHVQDATVVQTEEHVRNYLGEAIDYFWQERAEAFAAGQAPPLELEGYLAIERRRPACGDPQHIFNKLLFDALNEALMAHYSQAMGSFTARINPRLALLGQEQIEQNVVQRVLRWAGLGGSGSGSAGGGGSGVDLAALLAEDAAEEERLLAQLAKGMQAELAAGAAQPDSPQLSAAAGCTET